MLANNQHNIRHVYGRIYICENCGDLFKCKFQDYNLCATCLDSVHEEINSRLKLNFKQDETINRIKSEHNARRCKSSSRQKSKNNFR